MYQRSVAVIGAPLAAWALFGCLILVGASAEVASTSAAAWAVFWIIVAWFGTRRSGITASMRSGAIFTSLFLPLPTYLLSMAADWLALIPATVALPMFAILCSSAPLYFWILALRRRRGPRMSKPLMVMEWKQYNSQMPAGSIPPRTSSMRRAV